MADSTDTLSLREQLRRWHAKHEFWFDCVVPFLMPRSKLELKTERERLTAFGQAEIKKLRDLIVAGEESLVEYSLERAVERTEEDEERRKGVEARLTTVLGQLSLAATVVFGAMSFRTGAASIEITRFERMLVPLIATYILVQILVAVVSAIMGVSRQNYDQVKLSTTMPGPKEAKISYLGRRATRLIEAYWHNTLFTDDKVSFMAVAHIGLRNAVVGIFLLGLLVTFPWFVGSASKGTSVEDRVILKLRSDQHLLDLLRGPKGDIGPQGPVGPKGDPGPTGPAGPSLPASSEAVSDGSQGSQNVHTGQRHRGVR